MAEPTPNPAAATSELVANAMISELEAQRSVLGTRAAQAAGDRAVLSAGLKQAQARIEQVEKANAVKQERISELEKRVFELEAKLPREHQGA